MALIEAFKWRKKGDDVDGKKEKTTKKMMLFFLMTMSSLSVFKLNTENKPKHKNG